MPALQARLEVFTLVVSAFCIVRAEGGGLARSFDMRTMTPSAAIGVAVVLALVARTPGRNQQARSPGVLQSASSSPTASGTDHQVGLLHERVTV